MHQMQERAGSGDTLCRRRDFDLLSYGMQPPIFHPPGRTDKRVVDGRAGAPLAIVEKISKRKQTEGRERVPGCLGRRHLGAGRQSMKY